MNQDKDTTAIVSLKFPFMTCYAYVHPEEIKIYKPFNEDGYYIETLTEEEYLEFASESIEQTQITTEAFRKLDMDLPFDI